MAARGWNEATLITAYQQGLAPEFAPSNGYL